VAGENQHFLSIFRRACRSVRRPVHAAARRHCDLLKNGHKASGDGEGIQIEGDGEEVCDGTVNQVPACHVSWATAPPRSTICLVRVRKSSAAIAHDPAPPPSRWQ